MLILSFKCITKTYSEIIGKKVLSFVQYTHEWELAFYHY